jgi:hypothetical protein
MNLGNFCAGRDGIMMENCWLFAGYKTDKGYGKVCFWIDGRVRTYRVHRFIYEYLVGKIPRGKEIDHLCGVRCCINPKHLEAVIHQENCKRGIGSKTHCKNGHEFNKLNSYYWPNGHRQCKICTLARNKIYKARQLWA